MNPFGSIDLPQALALAAVLGWASGLRLYAALVITGWAGRMGWVDLPPGLEMLEHPAVILAASLMAGVELLADKIPFVDSLWDLVHTFIRIPAGAALAAAAMGAEGSAVPVVAAILGGSLAATAHAAKMTTRAAINASPEPFSNLGVSLLEDGIVVGMLWLAYTYPIAFSVVLAVVIVATVCLLIRLARFARAALGRIRRVLGGQFA